MGINWIIVSKLLKPTGLFIMALSLFLMSEYVAGMIAFYMLWKEAEL